jgi:hypothetical protein
LKTTGTGFAPACAQAYLSHPEQVLSYLLVFISGFQ